MKCPDELIKVMIEVIQNLGGDTTFTDSLSEQIEQQLYRKLGGQSIYIPQLDRDARRDIILREFNGRNREEVCTRHNISKRQFYRFIKGG